MVFFQLASKQLSTGISTPLVQVLAYDIVAAAVPLLYFPRSSLFILYIVNTSLLKNPEGSVSGCESTHIKVIYSSFSVD